MKEADGFVVELQKTLLGKARKKIKKAEKQVILISELTEDRLGRNFSYKASY